MRLGEQMPLATTSEIMKSALAQDSGVPAFNVIMLEHAEAIVVGAESAGVPVILQISENAVKFHGGRLQPIATAAAAVAQSATVPVSVHLDHVESADLMHEVVDTGISSVMFDASKLKFEENVRATRAAADWCHERSILIEAELGEVGGKGGAHDFGVRTDPVDAARFVQDTGVDALAVAVGSSHAMTSREASLDLDLIRLIHEHVPVPLVLHGSSGVPDDQISAAISAGMTKINIGTILNVAFTGAVREFLSGNESVVDPRKYLNPGREAMAATVAHLAKVVGGSRS